MSEFADLDAVVVGAGVTGLTAAVRLQEASKKVAVVEARGRVGGRLWTDTVDGVELELGGQWVSPDQTASLAMIEELGLETFSRYREGENVYIGLDGVRRTYTGDVLPVPPETEAEMERLIALLDDLSQKVDALRPWEFPDAEELDRISFAGWLAGQTEDVEARDNIEMYVSHAMLTKPGHAFSALQAIQFAASAGRYSHLVDDQFILDKRVVGGYQRIPLALADRLPGLIHLDSPVTRVEWGEGGVVVHTDRDVYRATRALLAVPPALVTRIAFDPPLPRMQMQARQHHSFGLVLKLHITYATPFWRELGLSGTAFSPYSPVHEAYDNTGHGDSRGTLVAFASDERADALLELSEEDRRATVLERLAAYYGEQALEPVAYYESRWAEEDWTAGAYGSSFDLGGLTRYGRILLEPVGPIRIASSDIAGLGFQHVDGALRMGEAMACEILSEL